MTTPAEQDAINIALDCRNEIKEKILKGKIGDEVVTDEEKVATLKTNDTITRIRIQRELNPTKGNGRG